MTTRSILAKTALGAAACAGALLATTSGAQAQAYYRGGYDPRGGNGYDPCVRDTTGRGAAGGLAGAAIGAGIGGSVAAGGAKTEGAVLGGLLGAVVGSQVGRNSAACAPGYGYAPEPAYAPPPPPPPPAPSAYYGGAYGGGAYGGAYGGTYYDPCARDRTQRGTTGGLVGGALGAVAGGNIAARNARPEGAVLGAIAGAAIGSSVGRNSAACAPGAVPPADYGYYDQGSPYAAQGYERYERYDSRYDSRYDQSYRDERDYYDRGYAAPVADARGDVNGCTLAESPIYLPDGRTQKRFVRVCPDANGRFQVVD